METMTQEIVDTCWKMYEKFKPLAHGSDDDRRKLSRMFAEQVRFDTGDANFGTKSTTANHPQSKDILAYRTAYRKGGGWLNMWDWQNGHTREPQIRAGQKPDHVEQHYFIAVEPVNHLGNAIPVPPNNPTPPNNPPSDNEVLKYLKVIETKLTAIETRIDSLSSDINDIAEVLDEGIELKPSDFPSYTGRQTGWAGGIINISPVEIRKNEE